MLYMVSSRLAPTKKLVFHPLNFISNLLLDLETAKGLHLSRFGSY